MAEPKESKALAEKNHIILVIGCPGAGKGTLAPKLANELDFVHVSVGDELRTWAAEHPNDLEIVKCVQQNELVRIEKLVLILNCVLRIWNDLGKDSFIIDGFPRSYDQIETFEVEVGVPTAVISMDCPREIAKKRVLSRNLAGRDDREEVFDKRYDEFERNQKDILEYYRHLLLLIRVDTSQEVEVTWPKLLTATQNIIKSLPERS